ncbi:MAG: GyrI-like domain-containing protein [Sphaerochaetaceae bacterium]|jgi:effector-binding domain-containing protein|nr:GyrI-like domain-containing protein [Sphaerochaetaceae bacterium]
MQYMIELIVREAMPSLAIRKTTAADHLPHEIGTAYAAIVTYLKELGVEQQKIGQPYVAYHNLDMQHLDVEMGFSTDKEYPGFGDIVTGKIPGGRFVTFLHKGPYKEMGHGYQAAQEWIAHHQLIPSGIVYEYYLNSPQEVPESELMTKVEFLLQG